MPIWIAGFSKELIGIKFLCYADMINRLDGGIEVPVPLERLASIHKMQEQLHPLKTKVFSFLFFSYEGRDKC